ncbi:transcriptional regulator, MerR family [Thermaerobacter marianensis DSM 12885]|uniref:Transcriptional regulator, MerR family n=2 Tax=Thermaerobacter marianensis TaxID=73919 RepID=E6SHP7_THEM7|nr:transcriptional regulator, MerR family [Thermaerobacter marianensis DSM 12885]
MYTMAVAERLTGLTQRQIRYYEARGLIRLARSPSGQRLLTARDIRQLRRIRWLLQQGHNVHTMRVLLAAEGAGPWPQQGAPEGAVQGKPQGAVQGTAAGAAPGTAHDPAPRSPAGKRGRGGAAPPAVAGR